MSIFKKKDTVTLRTCYCGGDLDGFAPDYATTLTLTASQLIIESKKAKATLDRDRLLSCEIFTDERQYTAKYLGHAAGGTSILSGTFVGENRFFIVFTFKAKDGSTKRMDFWYFALNAIPAEKLRKAINGGEQKEYSL